MSKKFIINMALGCLFLGIISLVAGYYYSRAFRYENITFDELKIAPSDLNPLTESEQAALLPLLQQKYRYLGEGNQVYAFVSSDEQHVLKFFKFAHLKPARWPWLESFFAHSEASKQWRIKRLFEAHTVAYFHDKENAGLIYVHLNTKKTGLPTIDVVDRYGWNHRIDLNDVFFILQRKGEPLRKIIGKALKEGHLDIAKAKLKSIITMYLEGYQHGICDADHNLWYNAGFAGELPMRLDVGKLTYNKHNALPEVYNEDLDKIINLRISRWLKKYYPAHHQEIMQYLHDFRNELYPNNCKNWIYGFEKTPGSNHRKMAHIIIWDVFR